LLEQIHSITGKFDLVFAGDAKRGKHLGEYDPETGEQTKPAKPGRTTSK